MTVKPFDLAGDLEQALCRRFLFGDGLQPRLAVHGFLQRNGFARRIGDQLGDAVHQSQRHLQHPPRIAHRGAGLQGTQRDDVGDAVGAIFVADIANDFVAPLLAEIDIEVRHGDTFGIEETLEEQAELQRVQIGDVKRPGDQRRGAGATHADGNALIARPFHEIGHDQKVTGKAHAVDDAQLIGQAFFVNFARAGHGMAGETPRQPLLRLHFQFLDRIAAGVRHEHRQQRFAFLQAERTTPGDLDGIFNRFRQIGEFRRHFRRGLEAVFARQAAAVILGDEGAVGNAQQGIMRLEHGGLAEMHVIGGDDGDVLAIGQIEQARLGGAFFRQIMALQFDIEPVAEHG